MYVVMKPFRAGGKEWKIGETVPDSAVRSPSLIRSNYVARIDSTDYAGDAVNPAETPQGPFEGEVQVNIPIITKDGSMALSVAPGVIFDAMRMLQSPADRVIEEIQGIMDEELLIILDACDQRKAVHTAVRKQAEVLKEAEGTEAGEAGEA